MVWSALISALALLVALVALDIGATGAAAPRSAAAVLLGSALRARAAESAGTAARSGNARRAPRRARRGPRHSFRCRRSSAEPVSGEQSPCPRLYDLVVIGAGTGGYVAAIRAAPARTEDRRRRAAEGARRHVPDLGLHPDQGAARARARAEDRRSTPRSGASRSATPTPTLDHRHDRSTRARTRSSAGLTKGVETLFKKNGVTWIKGTARLAGQGARRRHRAATSRAARAKHILVATGSSPRSVPGIAIDHKRIITSDEAIDLKEVPEVDRDPRQRRRRRRVRVDLQPLRQQGDDRRAAAAPRAGRGRGGVRGAARSVPQAGHHVAAPARR